MAALLAGIGGLETLAVRNGWPTSAEESDRASQPLTTGILGPLNLSSAFDDVLAKSKAQHTGKPAASRPDLPAQR